MNITTSSRSSKRPVWTKTRLLQEKSITLGFSLEVGSRASYSSAFKSYINFCTNHELDMKPTPDTLSLYAAYMSHFINPKSVSSYLSGICNHLEALYPDVREVRSHKLEIKRSQKSNHNTCLFFAILSTSFHGLMRLGENVWPEKKSLQDYRKVIMRSSVTMSTKGYSFLYKHPYSQDELLSLLL
ncbi:hypothetical protein FA15DRAFT_604789 [Coprinopsis marcescibilis]|uniref:Uncharacterized protein n=1 Tax=Coprinopsis marcescibilis TaxID=230819 RepID=A0A5C3KCL7_COPMA|nr:hypothetical protein FA15DRAFT_604789 [Coprinopsis marcescibilis]